MLVLRLSFCFIKGGVRADSLFPRAGAAVWWDSFAPRNGGTFCQQRHEQTTFFRKTHTCNSCQNGSWFSFCWILRSSPCIVFYVCFLNRILCWELPLFLCLDHWVQPCKSSSSCILSHDSTLSLALSLFISLYISTVCMYNRDVLSAFTQPAPQISHGVLLGGFLQLAALLQSAAASSGHDINTGLLTHLFSLFLTHI